MWTRGITGVVLCAVGAVLCTQGVGALRGSAMTGHPAWSFLGAFLVVVGVAFIGWAARIRKGQISGSD